MTDSVDTLETGAVAIDNRISAQAVVNAYTTP
jgi:hypothetical protein